MFYVYILKRKKDNSLYIGFAVDLRIRLIKHNKGLVLSTKSRVPFKLVYFEACLSKDNAIEREKALKTGFGRKFLRNRIK